MTTIYWWIEIKGEEKDTKITWKGNQPVISEFVEFIKSQYPNATKIEMAYAEDTFTQPVWKQKER